MTDRDKIEQEAEARVEARIVAWLREIAVQTKPFGLVDTYYPHWALTHAADAIARREHLPTDLEREG